MENVCSENEQKPVNTVLEVHNGFIDQKLIFNRIENHVKKIMEVKKDG